MSNYRSETNFASFRIIMLPNIIPSYGQPINTFIPVVDASQQSDTFNNSDFDDIPALEASDCEYNITRKNNLENLSDTQLGRNGIGIDPRLLYIDTCNTYHVSIDEVSRNINYSTMCQAEPYVDRNLKRKINDE